MREVVQGSRFDPPFDPIGGLARRLRRGRRTSPKLTVPKSNAEATRLGLLSMGRHSYSNTDPLVLSFQGDDTRVSVGQFTSISYQVTMLAGGNHRLDWVTTSPLLTRLGIDDTRGAHLEHRGNIQLGNDVWIGFGANVLSGVTIGDGAVVAAGALVSKDVAPYEIVGGCPQRTLGWRFDERVRAALLAIAWWDWEDEKVARHVTDLCSDRIEGFVSQHLPAARSA